VLEARTTFGVELRVGSCLTPRQGDGLEHPSAVRLFAAAVVVACVLVGAAVGASGDPDTSFGSGGQVLSDLGSSSNDQAFAVAVQKDGKIVAAGDSDANGSFDFALARYQK
jgi:predicted carbohydrate-binding protein with CBM5 and CBM33 domain